MNAKDPIKHNLDMSDMIVNSYVGDLSDADFLAVPVPGMNHIAWQLGHLISVERMVIEGIKPLAIKGLSDLPVVGQLLFGHNPLVYLSFVLFAAVQFFLYRTRAGLVLRAVGESPQSAHAIGYPVIAIRYAAVFFGGACSGLAGAYLSVAYTPLWVEGMVAGRGWIALALVVFATWKPWRVLAGAYLFGGVTLAQFQAQASGSAIPAQYLSMLPYLATIVVLAVISRDTVTIRLNAPASLGKPFHPAG